MKHIGELIRHARTSIRMDGKELASLAKIDPANLSRIEQGQVNPTFKTVERLLGALPNAELYISIETKWRTEEEVVTDHADVEDLTGNVEDVHSKGTTYLEEV